MELFRLCITYMIALSATELQHSSWSMANSLSPLLHWDDFQENHLNEF